LARLIGHPGRPIDGLKLDEGGWIASGTANNIKQARATVGVDSEVDSVIAGNIRIVVDINSGDAVRVDRGRDFGKCEVANLNVSTVTDVGLNPRACFTDDRPSDVVHCQQTVSTIAEE
jgi:hypothetical protein